MPLLKRNSDLLTRNYWKSQEGLQNHCSAIELRQPA